MSGRKERSSRQPGQRARGRTRPRGDETRVEERPAATPGTPRAEAPRVQQEGAELEEWIAEIDRLLSGAACELVLGSPSGSRTPRAAFQRAAAIVSGSSDVTLSAFASRVVAAIDAPATEIAARFADLEATWNAWKASRAATAASDDGTLDITPLTDGVTPADATDADAELAMLAADPELAGMFIAESLDHLSSIEALVLQVEQRPGDTRLLDDIFRPFHTIKGNAGALGIASVQELAHGIESLLDLARAGRHRIGPAEIDAILRSVDLLTAMIRGLGARLAGQSVPAAHDERRALVAQIEALARGAQDASEPPGTPVENTTGSIDSTSASTPADAAPPVRPADGRTRPDESLATVKVDTRKLDALVDTVGELVIVQSIIQEDPALQRLVDERLARNLGQLRRITSDLQRSAMSMRMTPIRPTFQKMARLVRDLSRKSGKLVDLVVTGEDTELDRKVVEDINDPLMHMVRNSIDHGIELPEARHRAGKDPHARVVLSARHEGGSIVIEIADDGTGLDTARIRARAVAQGLIPEGAVLGPSEIHELIFRPGFSTAEKVTEISGRGVGMDVVRRNIEALRGRIEIHTTPGAGTRFAIRLPLTLAIVEGLLLRAGADRFVLPTFSVRESLRPARSQVHAFQGRRRMIQVRNSLLPLIHLAELFGDRDRLPEPWDATVVVIEDNGRQVGLLVDELLGNQEVVIKALGDAFAHVRGVAGGAILGDGRVGLILDAGGLVDLLDRPLARAA